MVHAWADTNSYQFVEMPPDWLMCNIYYVIILVKALVSAYAVGMCFVHHVLMVQNKLLLASTVVRYIEMRSLKQSLTSKLTELLKVYVFFCQ